MSDDEITGGLDLLGDWLDAKGYGEEAGLCTRAMDFIHKQDDEIDCLRAENEKLRAALASASTPFELIAKTYGPYDPKDRDLSDFVDGYVTACDDIAKAISNYQIILNSSPNRQETLDGSSAAAVALKETGDE